MEQTIVALALSGAFVAVTVLHEYVMHCEETEENEKFDEEDIYDDTQ